MNLTIDQLKAAISRLPDFATYEHNYYAVVVSINNSSSLIPEITFKEFYFVKNFQAKEWELVNEYPFPEEKLLPLANEIIKELVGTIRYSAPRSNGLNRAYYRAKEYLEINNKLINE